MKAKNLILIALVAIAAGVALIIANKSINSDGVVVAGGVLFVIAGLLNIFVFYNERKHAAGGALASSFSLIGNIGALILGICMLIFQSTFIVLVPYIFGIVVTFLACYQFYVLVIGARPAELPAWFYLVPIILIGGAIYIFMCHPKTDDHLIILSSGIALCFFGLFAIIEASMIPHLRNKTARLEATAAEAKNSGVKALDDVHAEEEKTATPSAETTEK